jgi:chromate transport protein ChrA
LAVETGKLTQVMSALYVLKPAVLGIIAAGIIKLGGAAIRNFFLAVLLVGVHRNAIRWNQLSADSFDSWRFKSNC